MDNMDEAIAHPTQGTLPGHALRRSQIVRKGSE